MFKVRLNAMQALADAGGAITDSNGRATAKIVEASAYKGGGTAMTGLLKAMEADGLIERAINGKRCYRVNLTEEGWSHCVVREVVSEPETEVEPEPEAAVLEPAEPEVVEVLAAQEPEFDYDEFAVSLLKQFASTLEPVVKDPELQKRLGRLHEHAQSLTRRLKLAEQERDAYADQVRARIQEIGGLRERMRQTEENLKHLIEVPASVLERDQLDRTMRERVAVSMS